MRRNLWRIACVLWLTRLGRHATSIRCAVAVLQKRGKRAKKATLASGFTRVQAFEMYLKPGTAQNNTSYYHHISCVPIPCVDCCCCNTTKLTLGGIRPSAAKTAKLLPCVMSTRRHMQHQIPRARKRVALSNRLENKPRRTIDMAQQQQPLFLVSPISGTAGCVFSITRLDVLARERFRGVLECLLVVLSPRFSTGGSGFS